MSAINGKKDTRKSLNDASKKRIKKSFEESKKKSSEEKYFIEHK
ncbi:hypothetical protein [Gallaecimonas pentaromativorans]